MRKKLAALLAFTVMPVVIFLAPNPIPQHSRDWWVANTPKCLGPVCLNVFYDRTVVELETP